MDETKPPITIRDIIRETLVNLDDQHNITPYDEQADQCVQKIKQKLAHMRRVLFHEIEVKRLLQPNESLPGHETMSITKPLSTEDILDIVYAELDHCIEGLEDKQKNLNNLSKEEK